MYPIKKNIFLDISNLISNSFLDNEVREIFTNLSQLN